MVEPVGTAWPVLLVQSFLPSRRAERGVRRNQIGHSLGIERRRYFGCNCDQISLDGSEEIMVVTFFSKFKLPFECGKNKIFNL